MSSDGGRVTPWRGGRWRDEETGRGGGVKVPGGAVWWDEDLEEGRDIRLDATVQWREVDDAGWPTAGRARAAYRLARSDSDNVDAGQMQEGETRCTGLLHATHGGLIQLCDCACACRVCRLCRVVVL